MITKKIVEASSNEKSKSKQEFTSWKPSLRHLEIPMEGEHELGFPDLGTLLIPVVKGSNSSSCSRPDGVQVWEGSATLGCHSTRYSIMGAPLVCSTSSQLTNTLMAEVGFTRGGAPRADGGDGAVAKVLHTDHSDQPVEFLARSRKANNCPGWRSRTSQLFSTPAKTNCEWVVMLVWCCGLEVTELGAESTPTAPVAVTEEEKEGIDSILACKSRMLSEEVIPITEGGFSGHDVVLIGLPEIGSQSDCQSS